MATTKSKRGFSLVELVIVIVIIGVIAAIAVPRISRGAAGAGASALRADLHVLRNALDMYSAEHGGDYPAVLTFEAQLTQYTDDSGATSTTKDSQYKYGPYLIAVPVLKVGDGKGSKTVAAAAGAGVGWVYTVASGSIKANAGAATDESGDPYSDY